MSDMKPPSFLISDSSCRILSNAGDGTDAGIINAILSGFSILFSRYSSRDSIAFTAPSTSLSFQVDPRRTIREFLRENGGTGSPLFQEAISLVDDNLVLSIYRSEQSLGIRIDATSTRFSPGLIEAMPLHLETIFAYFANPDTCIGEIDILPEAERARILRFNGDPVTYPDKTVIQLFEEQVAKTPDLRAIVAADYTLTYRELDQKATRLAHHLKVTYSISPGEIVSIMTERSSRLIIGILGILKAGAAYLPIDPDCPAERLNHMLTETGTRVLLTDSSRLFDLCFFKGQIFALDMQLEDLPDIPDSGRQTPPDPRLTPGSLVYIIYTSGSTGVPKGVMINHSSLVNLCYWHRRAFSVTEDSRATLYASIAFDASVWEMWPYLLAGACLYPIGEELKLHLDELTQFFKQHAITHCFLPTPVCVELDNQNLPVDNNMVILTGGDKLHLSKNAGWNIVNNYGPTESAVVATSIRLADNAHAPLLPIGKPIDNIKIMILDNDKRMVPIGVEGELFIAGDGLAAGYIKRPELTREKFIACPFVEQAGEYMYATGDMGSWLEDGNIRFRGRKDSQVKIRGVRIELGEIETQLLKCPGVDNAVVLAEKDKKYICAWYVSKAGLSIEALKEFLHRALPEYMIPAYFIRLESFPLTSNGKIDLKALPQQEHSSQEEPLPDDGMTIKMIQVWKEVLQLGSVKTSENFFNQGGDSIKAIRLIYEINEAFGAAFKLSDIYVSDTPDKLVNALKAAGVAETDGALVREVNQFLEETRSSYLNKLPDRDIIEDIYPVADIQAGMFYHGFYGLEGGVYHDQIVHQVRFADFEPDRFRKALELMADRHGILRTAFDLDDMSSPVQIVYKAVTVDYIHVDIAGYSETGQQEIIQKAIIADRDHPLDPKKPGLWRMRTFARGNDLLTALFVCHHAIIDGWSDATFSTELNNIYLKLKGEPFFQPAKLECSYKDYVTGELIAKRKSSVREFWKNEFSEYKKIQFSFPLDDPHSTTKTFSKDLGITLKDKLKAFASENNISPRAVCFGVYLKVIRMLSLQEELIVGLHTHNRPLHRDSDKILGCFLNSIPVKYRFDEDISWIEHVKNVNRKMLELAPCSNLSLFEIARLNPAPGRKNVHNRFFDTLFAYLDFHVYDNLNEESALSRDVWKKEIDVSGHGVNNTFLNFLVNVTGDGFNLSISYKSTRIDAELIGYIAQTFVKGLSAVIDHPSAPVFDSSLSPGEAVMAATTPQFNL